VQRNVVFLPLIILLCHVQTARSDFYPPTAAQRAMSPDGNLLVRITAPVTSRKFDVAYYVFDAASDSYVRRSSFQMTGGPGEMMYVSNAGDLVLISLSEKDAIRLVSPSDGLVRSWDLSRFLSRREIKACARTGSTLQWLEEGAFSNDTFRFRGPSTVIRALGGTSYTVMSGAKPSVSFSGSLDAATGELIRQ